MWPAFLGGAFVVHCNPLASWPATNWSGCFPEASMQWLVHARKMGVGQRLCPCCSLWRKVAIRQMWWVTRRLVGLGWVSWGPGDPVSQWPNQVWCFHDFMPWRFWKCHQCVRCGWPLGSSIGALDMHAREEGWDFFDDFWWFLWLLG